MKQGQYCCESRSIYLDLSMGPYIACVEYSLLLSLTYGPLDIIAERVYVLSLYKDGFEWPSLILLYMYSAKQHALYLRESLQWDNNTDIHTYIHTYLPTYMHTYYLFRNLRSTVSAVLDS